MVRENRVKEILFPYDFSGANGVFSATTTATYYTRAAHNGQIEGINVKFNRAGSLVISESGTGDTILNVSALSGTNPINWRPRAIAHDSLGAVGAGSPYTEFTIKGPVSFAFTSVASGTQTFLAQVTYR